ncbi:MAG TPA: hypothetical protein VHN37_16140 [Actinomycetota bacterium]|nr:hypothetical protein [Actinomycetota bacterium]
MEAAGARAEGSHRVETVSLWCAIVTLLVAMVPVSIAVDRAGGKPSILVRMEPDEPMAELARRADPEFAFVAEAHYDGVYFYAVATDPLATGEAHAVIDKGAYRYGHAGYGWLGWIASAGQASAAPVALLMLGFAGLAVAAIAISRLSAALGWTPWGGLAIAFNPGLIYALTSLTSETVGAAFTALALLAWVRGRYVWGAAAAAAACLVKEPFVLVPAALALWEVYRWFAHRDLGRSVRRIALLSIGPVLFACWYVYIRVQFGEWSFEATEGFFAVPPFGWLEAIGNASSMAAGADLESQLGAASAPLLAAVGAAMIAGLVRAVTVRNPVAFAFVLLGLLALALRPLGVLFPKDLIRELSIPLMLLPLVLAARKGHGADDAPVSAG